MNLKIEDVTPYLGNQFYVLCLKNNIRLKVTGLYKKTNAQEHFDLLLLNWDRVLRSDEVKLILKPLEWLSQKEHKHVLEGSIYRFHKNYFESDVAITSDVLDLPYSIVLNLVKNGFDINNLIERGLAVPDTEDL